VIVRGEGLAPRGLEGWPGELVRRSSVAPTKRDKIRLQLTCTFVVVFFFRSDVWEALCKTCCNPAGKRWRDRNKSSNSC